MKAKNTMPKKILGILFLSYIIDLISGESLNMIIPPQRMECFYVPKEKGHRFTFNIQVRKTTKLTIFIGFSFGENYSQDYYELLQCDWLVSLRALLLYVIVWCWGKIKENLSQDLYIWNDLNLIISSQNPLSNGVL